MWVILVVNVIISESIPSFLNILYCLVRIISNNLFLTSNFFDICHKNIYMFLRDYINYHYQLTLDSFK